MELKINGLGTSQWQGGEEGGWEWAPPNLKQTENFLLLVLKLDGKQNEQCRTLMENVLGPTIIITLAGLILFWPQCLIRICMN